jgi:hypothetical protein
MTTPRRYPRGLYRSLIALPYSILAPFKTSQHTGGFTSRFPTASPNTAFGKSSLFRVPAPSLPEFPRCHRSRRQRNRTPPPISGTASAGLPRRNNRPPALRLPMDHPMIRPTYSTLTIVCTVLLHTTYYKYTETALCCNGK